MPPADYMKMDLVSHTRRVCSLYKKMLMDQFYHHEDYFEAKFKQLEIRREFDKNKNIKDIRKAKAMLVNAEKHFYDYEIHPYHKYGQPIHAFSKNGISEGRDELSPDYVMDAKDPLEKAQYPHYFSKREKMKDEYIALWKKKLTGGKSPNDDEHHHH